MTNFDPNQPRRLIQIRIDKIALTPFFQDERFLTEEVFPLDLLHVGKELKPTNKAVHYHIIGYFTAKQNHKALITKKLQQKLLVNTPPSNSFSVKVYCGKDFKQGESPEYYIGYCAKGHDPIFPASNLTHCLEVYEQVKKDKGNDEYFKDFILKHLTPNSTKSEIIKCCMEWYKKNQTQHSPLIVAQRYWQVLTIIQPEVYDSQMYSSVIKMLL